jgi:5-methyltetrahydrofolate--homocysteine methyltransferase
VHVNDASRAVTVVGDLLQKDRSGNYIEILKKDYAQFREEFLNRQKTKSYVSLSMARKNKLKIDWGTSKIRRPKELGIQVIRNFDLQLLEKYIDWTPFFRSWDLHGRFPLLLKDKVVGKQATELYKDAQQLLKRIYSEKLLEGRAIFGLFEANSVNDDDIEITITSEKIHFRTLRQQSKKPEGRHNLALADFVAPKESGVKDYMGCFCVSTGFGTAEMATKFEAENDDYNSIMIKALSDRLAEAFTEYLHEQVRKTYWGYAGDENFNNDELIKENYKGIRPAPGYPACPDHLEKETIWKLLQVKEQIGVELTESLAMWPAASVSGYYFANPEARYFGLGKIKKDQVVDFAQRKNISVEKATKWLQPNIAD